MLKVALTRHLQRLTNLTGAGLPAPFSSRDTVNDKTTFTQLLQALLSRRLLVILLLGFSSGLPLALTGSTLQAWYTKAGVDIVTIGFLALVGQPYVYKFLWAPILDRFVLPLLGRRRGWMLVMQLALLAIIIGLAQCNPAEHAIFMGVVAMVLAFLSATQDIAIDAYRTEILEPEERGIGSALNSTGYRIAMLVSGGFGFIMAEHLGWQTTYYVMAALMGIGIIATFISIEPVNTHEQPDSLYKTVVDAYKDFMMRQGAVLILLFMVFYKIGDAFALTLSTPFLLRGMGFSLTDVGVVTKIVGIFATIVGGLLGGIIMLRMRLFRALMLFGFLQAVANLGFMVLAMVGKNYAVMATAITIENIASGMGTTAFLAFLMSLCNQRYTATQYALFSALAAVGRVYVGPVSGVLVEHIGWAHFFFWTFIISLPALFLLWCLRNEVVFKPAFGPQVTS